MLVPGLDHRPDCFVFPRGQLASRHSKRVAQRVVTTHGHYTLSLHVGYRQTKPHIGWMLLENFYLNYRCSNCLGAWSLVWRERPAWKQGHWEHLDVTHEMADCARGECP